MKFWEVDLVLSNRLIKLAEDWHKSKFPNCRASLKINNMCNHYRWFLAGCRCLGLIASENEAENLKHLPIIIKKVCQMTPEEIERMREQALSDVESKLAEKKERQI